MRYLYLHGFGSSGKTSRKALWLRQCFLEKGLDLECPDLVVGDFSTLTLSGQLQVVEDTLRGERCCLVGSSFGGLVAANYAGQHPEVEALVLLAPAFGFPGRWVDSLGASGLENWRRSGWLRVYHHAESCEREIHYGFYEDAAQHPEEPKFQQRAVIVHGLDDETVPLHTSRTYVTKAPQIELVEVSGGHELDTQDALAAIWTAVEQVIISARMKPEGIS